MDEPMSATDKTDALGLRERTPGMLMRAGLEHGPLWLAENYPWQLEYLARIAAGRLTDWLQRFDSATGIELVLAMIEFDRSPQLRPADIDMVGEEVQLILEELYQLLRLGPEFLSVAYEDTHE